MSKARDSTAVAAWKYVAVAVVAVLIGAVLAPYAPSLSQPEPNKVVVVSIEGPITADSVSEVRTDLRQARQDRSVKAVVLRVNSPGGAVPATESLYLAVNRTAGEMPVVASVSGAGASGGYFAMLPADRIYTTPGSLIGSVGVIAGSPSSTIGRSGQIVTGPDKATGGTADDVRAQIETIHNEFLDTVLQHRGDKLSLSREELAYAKVYTGARAVKNGVADRIGGSNEAIAYAAKQANMQDYQVVRKEPPKQRSGLFISASSNGTRKVVIDRDTFGFDGVETRRYYALYGTLESNSEVKINGS